MPPPPEAFDGLSDMVVGWDFIRDVPVEVTDDGGDYLRNIYLPVRVVTPEGFTLEHVEPTANELGSFSTIRPSSAGVGLDIVFDEGVEEVVDLVNKRRGEWANSVGARLNLNLWKIVCSANRSNAEDGVVKRALRVKERVLELGRLGFYLLTYLEIGDLVVPNTAADEAVRVSLMCLRDEEVRAAAYSLLFCEYPIQIPPSDFLVRTIGQLALDRPMPFVEPLDLRDKEVRRKAFPLKTNPGT